MRSIKLELLMVLLVLSICIGQSAFAASLAAWGENLYGKCNVPAGNDFKAIAASHTAHHNVALKFDGSLVAWGRNIEGQCNVPAGNNFKAIAAGWSYSMAQKSDGSLVAWGNNASGQCNVPPGNDFKAIAAGGDHGLAIKSDGSLVAWGANGDGQCNVPVGDYQAIAAGISYSLALRSDGSLIAWGRNNYGQRNVPDGNNFTAITAGCYHNLALKSDGSVVAWGYNDYGQCNVPGGKNFTAIAAGWGASLALTSDGSLVGWGYNGFGECDVPAGNDFIAISGGGNHKLALRGGGPSVVTGVPPFWFLDARIRLVWTPGWITIPTGYWGGWFWWHHQCCWLRPWQGPLQWYWPYCYDYPYTCYWDYWPYYRCYLPWWHCWDWRGWPWFWGFKDCLTYRYWSWKPVIVYWWSYYWFSGGDGYCVELVTMDGGDDPAAPKVLPLSPEVLGNFEARSHEFNINGKVAGTFSSLQFIPVADLPHYFENIPGVTKDQVSPFMDSDITTELIRNDPSRMGLIGFQWARWKHPTPPLTVTAESLTLKEGETAQYGVCLREPPAGPTTIRVISFSPEDLEIADAGPDGVLQLHFDESDWSMPKLVTISAVDNFVSGGKKTVMVANVLGEDPNSPEGGPMAITLLDDEGPACTPYPEDRAVNVPQDVVLRWTPGSQAVTQDVYFGLDEAAVEAATPASAGIYRGRQGPDQSTFTPGALEWNRSYYWRIDDVNDASAGSPWKGAVWSFTTADFLVVDDFESYSDVSPNRVFQAWLDGAGFSPDEFFPEGNAGNASGALVGYNPTVGHIMEYRTVHSGRQSMPLDYNNTRIPFYSEAYREFSPLQDWTVNGVNTLVLYFQGQQSNTPGSLYVAVEDAYAKSHKVACPSGTNATTWIEWKMPLSQFAGVDMTRVRKMYVGVGDRDNPMHGGAGRLFIDDIRVIKPVP